MTQDERYDSLETEMDELYYKCSLILDYATGNRISKPDTDIEHIYKAIDENLNFWVDSAIKELQEPKSCEGCKYYEGYRIICYECIRFDKFQDYYEPKEDTE